MMMKAKYSLMFEWYYSKNIISDFE